MKKFLFALFIFAAGVFFAVKVLPEVSLFKVRENPQNNISPKLSKIISGKDESQEAAKDRPDQAFLYEKLLRSEIGKPFSYHGNWRFEAMKQARAQNILRKRSSLNWVERGPANIGGRSRSIVIHPQNPDIWWVGAVGGGVWKTEDAGAHWRPLTDDMPVISVTTIDICKNKPDILYAGTGEGFGNYDQIIGDGIFKTTDGGENWIQLPASAGNYNFRYVNRLVVHPFNADTVLAATNAGIFRSLNGGDSWEHVFNPGARVQQIIANPLNFNTLFACVNNMGIYKSTDMGNTWNYVSEEISDHRRVEMAIAPSDTSYLYAAMVNSSGQLAGFYQSTDAGITWNFLGSSPNWLGKQGWYDNTLIVHPFNKNIVFVGGLDLYQVQVNSGSMSATQISSWWGGYGLPYVHADHHFLATIPKEDSSFALLSANDGGIYFSPDGGVNWQNKNYQYNVTQYYDADRHPFLEQYIGGTQDNGTSLSPVDPDSKTGWHQVVGGDGFDCAWDKFDPYIVYATIYDSRVFKSTDGGNTFQSINNGLPESEIFHTPLVMDPFNTDKLLTISESNKIYITYNGGLSWKSFPVQLNGSRWVRIAVSQADSSIVWIASSSGYINVSADGGKSFTTVPKPPNAPNAIVSGIATHPSDSATALVMFGVSGYGKIFRTRNLGNTWEDITNNLPDVPVHCAVYIPYDTSQIWIGTDIGLFISQDNGESWQFAEGTLPSVAVRRLKIVNKEIVAATHGRGIWSLYDEQLPELTVPTRSPVLSAVNPPHPSTKRMKVFFRTRSPYDSVHVEIYEEPVVKLGPVPAYRDTFAIITVEPPDYLEIQTVGFNSGKKYISNKKSIVVYEKVDSVKFLFNNGYSDFYGDFFIDKPQNFGSAGLQTEHPYSNKRDYISILGTPVVVSENLVMTYKDIALVEPGESGYFYPDYRMWDYVTVEGSLDGENWDVLITPYDCRFDPSWNLYYNQDKKPDDSLYRTHEIDLTEFYDPGQIIYVRFRLHADDYTTGWGWIIDDVKIKPSVGTAIARNNVAVKFQLLNNYPNPFNPQTTISFTLDRTGDVSLKIYNTTGQLVRTLINNEYLFKGNLYKYVWRGRNDKGNPVASGVYFYHLTTSRHKIVKKMVLMR
ncbi:MAG: T9SS type A sorting domain-containing protein [Calditrichaeota bacterium]|nr:T9SS type A sorting domain-containing protein [Calditrichota bacterium]